MVVISNQQYKYSAATFTSHREAERAIQVLNKAGFSRSQLSIVPLELNSGDTLDIDAPTDIPCEQILLERATGATLAGTLLGAVGGCLIGLGFLILPGVGLLVALGTAEATLISTVVGAGVGAVSCGLAESLSNSKLCKEQLEAEANGYLYQYSVIVNGTEEEVRRAEALLHRT